jgi:hypothetical protein
MRLGEYSESKSVRTRDIVDANAQKQQVEEKIRAAEDISNVILENAARREIVAYITERNARPVAT